MTGQLPIRKHTLRSKAYRNTSGDVWWFAIPKLGKKYRYGDSIRFVLRDYYEDGPAEFTIKLDPNWVARLEKAARDRRGNAQVHVWRYGGPDRCKLALGAGDHDAMDVHVTRTKPASPPDPAPAEPA
jgi:hypothetical protein